MGKVRTVLGDIAKSDLGFTYSHEHLWSNPPYWQKDRDLEITNYEASLKELKIFKTIGGETIVEGSVLDYGRDASKLKRMSDDSGVNVVASTGLNKHIYYDDWAKEASVEELAEFYIRDIIVGMDGTDARAGLIKTGAWYNLVHKLEEKATIATAIAHLETGAPIWIHTEAGTMGLELLDILENEGVDLKHVVVGHSDRNADEYYHLKILERGAYIGFDGLGKIKYYPDSVRIALIKNVLSHGYADRLMLSGDMGRQSYLESYGGGPGFRFIKEKFIPRMLDEGIEEGIIKQIFYNNPADWLAKFD